MHEHGGDRVATALEQLTEDACAFLRARLVGDDLEDLEDYIVGFIIIGAPAKALRGAAALAESNDIELPPHLHDAIESIR